jgi:hypothetical protein
MVEGREYDVSYSARIGLWQDRLVPVRGFDISHANLHSCFASVTACTPSIADTPGLSTHTVSQTENVDGRGGADFTTSMSQLPPGEYTVIAHIRFSFAAENEGDKGKNAQSLAIFNGGGKNVEAVVQYDAAIGLKRSVRANR